MNLSFARNEEYLVLNIQRQKLIIINAATRVPIYIRDV